MAQARAVWLGRSLPPAAVSQRSEGVRLGHLLHAGGEVRRLPHGGVIHMQVTADGPHNHLAGIEAYADLDRPAVRRSVSP